MAKWYDGIFKMHAEHRPTDDVIEDDDKLDRYMEALHRQLARQSGRAGSHGPIVSLLDDDPKDNLPTWKPGM